MATSGQCAFWVLRLAAFLVKPVDAMAPLYLVWRWTSALALAVFCALLNSGFMFLGTSHTRNRLPVASVTGTSSFPAPSSLSFKRRSCSICLPVLVSDSLEIWVVLCASAISLTVLCTPRARNFSVLVHSSSPSSALYALLMSASILFRSHCLQLWKAMTYVM